VLQQCQEIDRAEAAVDRGTERPQQRGRRRIGERLTGRIVDVDVPAPELGRDAARQFAIGGDQRGGAARRIQRFAQRQRDRHRLLVRGCAVGARDMIERRRIRARPGLAGFRRPHQFGDQLPPRPVAPAAAGPVRHCRPRDAQRAQKFMQAELRMRGIELFPARVIHLAIQPGQHDSAARQAGDRRQQIARRRL
jgi:hypothetical protein